MAWNTAVEMVSQPQETRSGSVEVKCVACGRTWRQTFRKIAKATCWTCHPPRGLDGTDK